MSGLWIPTLPMFLMYAAQSVDSSRLSFISVKVGENITLNCPFGADSSELTLVIWYKQIFGEMPRAVGERLAYTGFRISPEFKSSGYKMKMTGEGISLIIQHVKKDHGGLYYCGQFSWENVTLSRGNVLSVTGDEDVKVSVIQSGVSDSVPAGASVTLQCSVLSESRAAELQVLWFRAAPPQSHPQIIYTHHNSSHQCESSSSTHTCVYNFSKNILSVNDTGTYYCAVAVCGKIIFGNGTPVQMKLGFFNPVVMSLGTVLLLCGILISVQAVLLYKGKNCNKYRERFQHGAVITAEKTNTQDHDTVELNYAALHFNERKTKRARGNQRRTQECVYSEVKSSSIT